MSAEWQVTEQGTWFRVAADGGEWTLARSRAARGTAWVLAFDCNPAGRFPDLPSAMAVARQHDECRPGT